MPCLASLSLACDNPAGPAAAGYIIGGACRGLETRAGWVGRGVLHLLRRAFRLSTAGTVSAPNYTTATAPTAAPTETTAATTATGGDQEQAREAVKGEKSRRGGPL